VWTLAAIARDNRRMMPPRPPLTVVKLSDHFGQYVLTLRCECGHTRTAQPKTLAVLAGWGCAAGGCREAVALLTVREATMQRHRAARGKTRWLSVGWA
jgi:hypothetical protein